MGDANEREGMSKKKAIIIGAGPAGLTAAYELLERTDVTPVIYETADIVGGISKTVDYKGNKIDIGGHRFFSKSAEVEDWWLRILPLQGAATQNEPASGADPSSPVTTDGPDPEKTDAVMLWRRRQSRILYSQKLFDYPIVPSLDTLRKLGPFRVAKILVSYLRACIRPIKDEHSLEDFLINRFGRELYQTFFKDYTEKLWGIPCTEISPAWGAQRIKGLSLTRAMLDVLRRLSPGRGAPTETSLIRHFMYPKLGPGQLWTEVARRIEERGGTIHRRHTVTGLTRDTDRIRSLMVRDEASNQTSEVEADYFFSTMPVKDLFAGLTPPAPPDIRHVAEGLMYRDFMTVGLLLKDLHLKDKVPGRAADGCIADCWLYIQEPDVKVGRIQIFNNWSPYLVRDPKTVWLGLEYFCNEGEPLWNMSDAELSHFAVEEMINLGFITATEVLDSTVIRMPKAYPAYFGTHDRFPEIRSFTDRLENLFLIGRNGMHKYNNSDHSMLSAMRAVESVAQGITSKEAIWSVNTEVEYHEVTYRKATRPPKETPGKNPDRGIPVKTVPCQHNSLNPKTIR